jgi:protein TonB
MRLWLGVLFSVLFHAVLFLIPVAVSIPTEHTCEDLEFVIVQEAGEGSAPADTQDPAPAEGQPPDSSARSVPETAPQPEEPRDTPDIEDAPPPPEDEPAPTMLAREVPKPPQPVKKPPKRVVKPPRPEKPVKVQPQPKTVSADVGPADQPATRQTGLEPGRGESNPQATEAHSSVSNGDGSASQGPVDSSFGSSDGPRFQTKALPKYPRLARELGKEGTVLLRLTIDERGRLMNVEVVKPAGSGFDEEAVQAVKSSTFSPAKKGGKPVMCRAHLPIRFVLRSSGND